MENKMTTQHSEHSHSEEPKTTFFQNYYPLILIFIYISLAAFVANLSSGPFTWAAWMTGFMAGFFLVFSAFKFLDLKGFAHAYAMYDLLAKRWLPYAFIYPFLELALGLGFLSRKWPILVNLGTIIIMGFSTVGVIQSILEKKKIRCACLGTVINLPVSTITLVEDLLMVLMAIFMIVHIL